MRQRSYTFPMDDLRPANLSWQSFDEFVSFLFDRNVPKDSEESEPWYYAFSCGDFEFDPDPVCDYYIQLFSRPEALLGRFSRDQLEQGFWAIQGPNLACSVYRLLFNNDLRFERKIECISSMFGLFSNLFSVEPLDTSASMWWDALCYDWHCGNRRRERGGEDADLQDAFFKVLSRILLLDSTFCQGAALHGLGHLHHPDTKGLISQYIQQRPSLPKELQEYALAAGEFKVM